MNRGNALDRCLIGLLALLVGGILTMWLPDPWGTGVFHIATFTAGIAFAYVSFRAELPLRPAAPLVPLVLAAAWPLLQLSAGWTVYAWLTWEAFWNWLAFLTIFFIAYQVASGTDRLRRFLKSVLYFSLGLSVLSVVQMYTSGGKFFWLFKSGYSDFVLGPFVYRNQYAAFIELTLPVALFFALIGTNAWRYVIMAAVMTATVIASASRAGVALVTAELILLPLLAVRLRLVPPRLATATLWRTAALGGVAAVIAGYTALWQRFLEPDPYFLRREVFTSAIAMIGDRPVTGFGLGTWVVAYPKYAIFDPGVVINQAHNDWLQWAAEGGLPFAALMVVFAFLLIPPALRSVWGAGVLFVFIHASVDYPFQQRPALAAFVFAMAGAVAGAGRARLRDPQRVLSVQASFTSGPPNTIKRFITGS